MLRHPCLMDDIPKGNNILVLILLEYVLNLLFVGGAANVLTFRETLFFGLGKAIRSKLVFTLTLAIGDGPQKAWIFASSRYVVFVLGLLAGYYGSFAGIVNR